MQEREGSQSAPAVPTVCPHAVSLRLEALRARVGVVGFRYPRVRGTCITSREIIHCTY